MILDPETDLSFTRTLKAPRTAVWAAWTRPEHIRQFFVPAPHTVTACEIDLRVGGKFNTVFDVEGQSITNTGVYLEIIEGERLVFTDAYSEGWKPAPDPFMTAIIDLADTEHGGTRYTATARHRSTETCERHKVMGFYEGWGQATDQLDAYASTLKV